MKKQIILICLLILCLYGCKKKEGSLSLDKSDGAVSQLENIEEKNDIIQSVSHNALNGTRTDDEFECYAQYDWLHDENIWKSATWDSTIRLTLADINLDGKKEMLITILTWRQPGETLIYSVGDGTVKLQGKVNAGFEFGKNDFTYWPEELFDVYQNEEGKVRLLSCGKDEHENFGSSLIYQTDIEGKEMKGIPVYAMVHTSQNTYAYWDKEIDVWQDENLKADNKAYTELCNVIKNDMADYQKKYTEFFYIEYQIPGNIQELNEKEKNEIESEISEAINGQGMRNDT